MKLNIQDLNKLKYFQAVAASGSLISASKLLNLTTSAIYQSIKKLELDLNIHLFYRSGKKYIITKDGEELLGIYQKFAHELENFCDEHSLQDQDMQGEIKIGLPPNYSKTVFSKFAAKFSDKFPLIKFNLYIGEPNYLLEMVEKFQIDLAVIDEINEIADENKFSKKIIHEEELVMVSTKDFVAKDIKEFQKLPHLIYSVEQILVQAWYRKQFKKRANIKNFNTVDNVETVLSFVKEGMGLGIVPFSLVKKDILKGTIQVHGNPKLKLFNNLYLIQNLDYYPNKAVKTFLHRFSDF